MDWSVVGWAAMPEASRKVSSDRLFGQAWAVELANGGDPQAMAGACLAYSRDPTAWGVSGRPVSGHKFLGEGRWRSFAGSGPGGSGGVARSAMPALSVPTELAEAVAEVRDERFAASWLGRASWDPGARVLTVSALAHEKLRPIWSDPAIAALNITLKERTA